MEVFLASDELAGEDKDEILDEYYHKCEVSLAKAFNGLKALYGLKSIHVAKTWDNLAHLYSYSDKHFDVSIVLRLSDYQKDMDKFLILYINI